MRRHFLARAFMGLLHYGTKCRSGFRGRRSRYLRYRDIGHYIVDCRVAEEPPMP